MSIATETAAEETDDRLIKEWGAWLNGFDWSWFATLTFRNDYSAESAARAFARWVDATKAVRCWFLAVERSPGGVIHLHVLCNAPRASDWQLEKSWRYGRADFAAYDRAKGATWYLVKGMTSGSLVHYDISQNLAPLDPDE